MRWFSHDNAIKAVIRALPSLLISLILSVNISIRMGHRASNLVRHFFCISLSIVTVLTKICSLYLFLLLHWPTCELKETLH
jgi:hypothetical protein